MTDSLKGVLNNYIQVLLLYRLIHGISLYINDADYMVGCYEMVLVSEYYRIENKRNMNIMRRK